MHEAAVVFGGLLAAFVLVVAALFLREFVAESDLARHVVVWTCAISFALFHAVVYLGKNLGDIILRDNPAPAPQGPPIQLSSPPERPGTSRKVCCQMILYSILFLLTFEN